ncbi:MAG: DNA primase [Alphaproteobacteria bacterium]|nr:DNA primase [Alphaproteobacteria bacterium]QQS56688.1 MAG: DNA primase [Alphaproteobacteria bacterium]
MTLPPRFLDELRSRLTLSDIIGRKVRVVRAGREFKACCPFHREKTPSFTISDDKHFFHCFGCGAHGDSIGFLMRHDNLSFMDAVETLAAEAGMQVPQQNPRDIEQSRRQKDLFTLMEETTCYFQECLRETRNKQALGYLLGRGLNAETIEAYRIGYAPEEAQLLGQYLRGQGYSDADMIQAGVLKESAKGRGAYAFFRGRIMFPVTDRRGRTVAFGGRILPEHLRAPDHGDFKPPKYINSPDSPLFNKSRVLYGEPHARMAATSGEAPIVVEGYLDVIACAVAGMKSAVAPMGTALTDEQILLLWKMIPGSDKEPLLCFDGDSAGRRAAERARDRLLPLLQPGQSARIAFLPEGEDPDTMIRSRGADSFRAVLGNALPLVDFLWTSLTAGRVFTTPESQAGLKKELLDQVARIADRDVQSLYRQKLLERFSQQFFRSAAKNTVNSANRNSRFPAQPPVRSPARPLDHRRTLSARILLAAVVNHPHIYEQIEEGLGSLEVSDVALDRFRQELVTLLAEDSNIGRTELIEKMNAKGFSEEIHDILSESVYVHASFCSPRAQPESVASSWVAWKEAAAQKQAHRN